MSSVLGNFYTNTFLMKTGCVSVDPCTITLSSRLCLFVCLQCSECAAQYAGTPLNGSQCYEQLAINNIVDYTLSSRHATFIAVAIEELPLLNSDIYLSFVVVHGNLDIYLSTFSMAVRVEEEGPSAGHSIYIPSQYQVSCTSTLLIFIHLSKLSYVMILA